jgi:hypothetical protein
MSQQGQGGAQQGGGGKRQPQKITIAAASFMTSSFTMMARFLSPFDAFINYGQAIVALVMFTVLGNAFAFFEGGLVVAEVALLIAPSFILALLSIVTTPFIKPFANAIARSGTTVVVPVGRRKITIRSANYIMRPVYDLLALLTVGLPFSLAWFWEGKILATGLSMLGYLSNGYYLGMAIAYYATAFVITGFLYTITATYVNKGLLGGFTQVIRAFSLVFSMYLGFIIADIIFFVWAWLSQLPISLLLPPIISIISFWQAAGALGGFILSLLTIDSFRRVVPNIRRVPITWNIMALLIGATAFMGTYFFVYTIVALAIYMMMLYLISGDGTWLWYAVIVIPSSPAIAYYLGFITMLLLHYTSAAFVAMTLLTAMPFVMLAIFIVIIVIIVLPFVAEAFAAGGFVAAIIIAIIVAIISSILALGAIISTVVSYIQAWLYLGQAYSILIAPA